MELQEAISLIQTDEIIQDIDTTWADLGCGSGLFTRALADLLYFGSTVYAIDKNISSFRKGSHSTRAAIKTIEADFVRDDLNLRNLDGILMANTLHFVRDKKILVEKLNLCLRSLPVFLIVEYDTDKSNPWVPYPVSYTSLKNLFTAWGFHSVRKISVKKSVYHSGHIYSALITR